ncbi:NAD(P)/FAD-dependent oxidoreductase [Opitutus sp. GAS368]|uniref:phytoene desaturase family protein n=1 Tax=Opitutus sp. GAS368 TaxID=1882749 RepID=UPI00087CF567|nr:NAD(P)/FAD-dependent oxidoreductase [Opitutus sp. GAS368]SDS57701.1 Phytoene dehydrogenase-related protein [Opitutus sp. GAS368]
MKDSHYDVAIIGAGMSGLAAGIRLAHFGRKVCIFERHNAPGGLNSFYSLGGRKYDVGLHAMTNYVAPGVKGTPLGKLLRQLRIEREEFALCPQKQSRVSFGPRGETTLKFTNDFAVLDAEVAAKFPVQADGWRRLVGLVKTYDDVSLDAQPLSAREVVGRHITDPLLTDMIFCPVMYYGSAQERDMEFGQFVIMFKALYLEGFARPLEGVRVIIRVLLDKFRSAGGERRMKCGVQRIIEEQGRAARLLLDDGTEITAGHVISSIGYPETMALCRSGLTLDPSGINPDLQNVGQLSFIETISVFNRQPAEWGWGDDTIIFFNDSARFEYAQAKEQVDIRSGVICLPNNFDFAGAQLPEGLFRVTCLANYDRWAHLPEEQYQADKKRWFAAAVTSARRFLPAVSDDVLAKAQLTTDMFTPRTIRKFTGHLNGAIYGAPHKIRNGRTHLQNLYLCGTDQGFLGIVGAMLSGISMANYHVLQAKG